MASKTKLELTWPGKEDRPRLEPRILIEQPALSHHAATRREGDIFDNMLIQGDNLLALKALEASYAGKVKCIYIDPPYNTQTAIPHYDDGLEHSTWLTLMRDRLELLRGMLSEDGSIWISVDDNENHYLKVVMDEIFGRTNFVSTIIWQMIYTTKNSARHFSDMHDYILVYAKSKENFRLNLLPRDERQDEAYKNLDLDPRGPWKATPLHARNYYAAGQYKILAPDGRSISPPSGTYWRVSEDNFRKMEAEGRIWWGRDGSAVPAQKRFLTDVKQGLTPTTLWLHSDAGHNGEAKNEVRLLLDQVGESFLTPKPERLIARILTIATNPGDLVLDSFAGSGTTGAVAHKMGRRWIMVELGEHARTHIVPRLNKVIDGEDKGGVTEATGWQGGGGYRFYSLAPSLLSEDKYGNWVISKDYNPEMLAEALCKHMGYTYAPSQNPEEYWKHGQSTETDFIYVTTQQLTHDACRKIADDVGPDRSLLICCKAFSARPEAFDNLTLVKIPTAILTKCEWGRDDYSLAINALPLVEDDKPDAVLEKPVTKKPGSRKKAEGPTLFDEGDED